MAFVCNRFEDIMRQINLNLNFLPSWYENTTCKSKATTSLSTQKRKHDVDQ